MRKIIVQLISLSLYGKKEKETRQAVVNCFFNIKKQIVFFFFFVQFCTFCVQLISLILYAKETRKFRQTVVNCIFYKKKQTVHNSLTSFSLFFCVQFCKFCVRKSIVQLISLILVYRSVARLALAFTTVHTSSHDPLRFQSSHQVSYVTFFFL